MATHLGSKGFTCVVKPWGEELIWTNTDKYIGKLLIIKLGEELSLQYHEKKTETLLVLDGKLEVTYGQPGMLGTYTLTKGDTIHLEPGTVHKFKAIGTDENQVDVLLIEVSSYFPNDIKRLEDKYGRTESDEVRKE